LRHIHLRDLRHARHHALPRMSGKARRRCHRRKDQRVTGSADAILAGFCVGHSTDVRGATGVTVIRRDDGPMRCGVAVFGRATGSRELLAASADHLVDGRIDAIMLTGGSAYGLDAAAGVMRWMEEQRRGFSVGAGVVPIVPAAVVFDLTPLGAFDARPTAQMAYDACASARSSGIAEGSVGAGTGTTVGKLLGFSACMKGGIGIATETVAARDVTVVAVAVVNALGDVRDSAGAIIAGARRADGGFADTEQVLRSGGASTAGVQPLQMTNTTLAVVAVSRPLGSTALTQLARSAGAALFRRITPCGTSSDGDVVFAISPVDGDPLDEVPLVTEALATSALEQAIERAVRFARGRDGIPGLADAHVN
jgi:L-aminopeptidase/D-esterase-like protein